MLSYRKSGTLGDAEKLSKIQKETKFMAKWTDNFLPYATYLVQHQIDLDKFVEEETAKYISLNSATMQPEKKESAKKNKGEARKKEEAEKMNAKGEEYQMTSIRHRYRLPSEDNTLDSELT